MLTFGVMDIEVSGLVEIACLMTFLALSGKDGVLPTRCELVGSGKGRAGKVLAIMGRARV